MTGLARDLKSRSVTAPVRARYKDPAMNRTLLTASLLSTALLFSNATLVLADDSKAAATSETESAQPGTDTWITTKVKADLLATENVDGTKINVTTINGVVTLAGVLDDKAQVDRAIALTKAIDGVKDVDTRALKSRS
jgi:hyperosmotically inducible periplasmic protein